jgi:hypothetical protein
MSQSCLLRRRSVHAESGACRFGTRCACVLMRLVRRSFYFFIPLGLQRTDCEAATRHLVHVSFVRLSLFHSNPARRLPGARPLIQKSDGHEGHRYDRLDFLNCTAYTVLDPSWLAIRPLTPHDSLRRRDSTRPPHHPPTHDLPPRRDTIASARSPMIFWAAIFHQLAR